LTLSNGRYKNELYLFHAYSSNKKEQYLLLVSNEHIFLRKSKNLEKIWKESIKSECKPFGWFCSLLIANSCADVRPQLEVSGEGIVIHLRQPSPANNNKTTLLVPGTDRAVVDSIFLKLSKILTDVEARFFLNQYQASSALPSTPIIGHKP
jgi:hypothetical protein